MIFVYSPKFSRKGELTDCHSQSEDLPQVSCAAMLSPPTKTEQEVIKTWKLQWEFMVVFWYGALHATQAGKEMCIFCLNDEKEEERMCEQERKGGQHTQISQPQRTAAPCWRCSHTAKSYAIPHRQGSARPIPPHSSCCQLEIRWWLAETEAICRREPATEPAPLGVPSSVTLSHRGALPSHLTSQKPTGLKRGTHPSSDRMWVWRRLAQ